MSETPQYETASEKLGKIDPNKKSEIEPHLVADALEEGGQHELAANMRAAWQHPLTRQSSKSTGEILIEKEKAENRQIEAEAAKRGKAIHDPRFDARRLGTQTMEAIKNLLKPADQNRPPTAPNTPNGTPPKKK